MVRMKIKDMDLCTLLIRFDIIIALITLVIAILNILFVHSIYLTGLVNGMDAVLILISFVLFYDIERDFRKNKKIFEKLRKDIDCLERKDK